MSSSTEPKGVAKKEIAKKEIAKKEIAKKEIANKEIAKKEIVKRGKLETTTQGNKWLHLKREIAKHQAMRAAIIKEMENQKDPVFRRFLKIYKRTLSPADFECNRLKIYAMCNKHAMYNCITVDEMVNVVVFGHPPT